MKAANIGPTGDSANEWTDWITPLRVMKVPISVSSHVSQISTMFQTFSIPRRSWIMMLWMNAVAVSQGRNEAFSTASQAQKPPQPNSIYAHCEPSKTPSPRNIHATSVHLRIILIQVLPSCPVTSAATANANGTVMPTKPR